jgi:hypothetical protein|nr:MAG TPA_asm: Portal protein, Proximal tail tube, phi29, mature virion, VIRUS.3A [Caudoviricetes sp.]
MHVLLTLNSMLDYYGNTFDNIVIPDGADKEVLIDTIRDYCGDNECRYYEPVKLKKMVEVFFKMYQYKYERLWLSTQQEYEMIENYDRKEETTENIKGDTTRSNKGSAETTTDTTSIADRTKNSSNINSVSAYNAQDFSNKDKAVLESSESDTDTNNMRSNASGTSEDKENENRNRTVSTRAHGNIGVTTSQQMIRSEREDVANFSWYYTVAMDFEDAITISVY